jgi:hypothetical protein
MTEEGATAPTKGGKKGKGKGEVSKGKNDARSSNPTGVPSHAELIEGQDARESEGTSSPAMSSNIRAPAPKAKCKLKDAKEVEKDALARARSQTLHGRKEAQQARNSGRHHPEGDVIFQPRVSPPPTEEYLRIRLRRA